MDGVLSAILILQVVSTEKSSPSEEADETGHIQRKWALDGAQT